MERKLTREQLLTEEAAGMNLDWDLMVKYPNGIGINSAENADLDPQQDKQE